MSKIKKNGTEINHGFVFCIWWTLNRYQLSIIVRLHYRRTYEPCKLHHQIEVCLSTFNNAAKCWRFWLKNRWCKLRDMCGTGSVWRTWSSRNHTRDVEILENVISFDHKCQKCNWTKNMDKNWSFYLNFWDETLPLFIMWTIVLSLPFWPLTFIRCFSGWTFRRNCFYLFIYLDSLK